MKKLLKKLLKQVVRWKYAEWKPSGPLQDGYSIYILSPMDMPFLLRFTLEGLRFIDTSRCREILVIPDGWGTDDGAALKEVMKEFSDPRIRYVPMSRFESKIGQLSGDTYWLIVVHGINATKTKHAFLHDADAFFLETNGIERIYQAALDGKYDTMGVTPRWDPFFTKINYQIPGTWELIFSIPWVRTWKPYHVRGQLYDTPHGVSERPKPATWERLKTSHLQGVNSVVGYPVLELEPFDDESTERGEHAIHFDAVFPRLFVPPDRPRPWIGPGDGA